MTQHLHPTRTACFLLGAVCAALAGDAAAAESVRVSDLAAQTHIHGLAVDRQDPARLLIATHHGLFRSGPGGAAERISVVQDFMGFNAHPTVPGTLYASGHPASGGNLGFIASSDHGLSWQSVSPGVGGPVDFHQMSVSPADPATIYGAYGDLQISGDAGETWAVAGPAPEALIDLAASARDRDRLYAATESGLLASSDAGATWQSVLEGAPVSLVEVSPDGRLFVFMLGRGLLVSGEEVYDFTARGSDWGETVLLHLAVDPADPDKLFAATHRGDILQSGDGGKTWSPLGG